MKKSKKNIKKTVKLGDLQLKKDVKGGDAIKTTLGPRGRDVPMIS